MVDTAFLGELERIFKEEFLKAAPLYQASSKIKLPYEDLHRPTQIYRGALKEVTRQVETIADYERFPKTVPDLEEIIALAGRFGWESGTLVNGLIRMENVRSGITDGRDVRNMKVIDVFEHADGRRNLQVFLVTSPAPEINGPGTGLIGWVGYKFVFAAAAIVLEYKSVKE